MRIKKKDLLILEIIEKTTVITSTNLTILAGYHDVSVVRKRLKALVAAGYVDEHRYDGEKLFFLTGKGLAELEISRKPYSIRGFSTYHYAEVSAAATWVYTQIEASIYDMALDRDITKAQKAHEYTLIHAPDVIVAHACVEVELNAKTIDRMERNYRENDRHFLQQVWILPQQLSRLGQRLTDLSTTGRSQLTLLTLEEMHDDINRFDKKSNVPREVPLCIPPAPIPQAERRVILHD